MKAADIIILSMWPKGGQCQPVFQSDYHLSLIEVLVCVYTSLVGSRLTSALEEDHDVRGPAGDLLEVQRDDVAVELEGLGDGVVHLVLRQISGVLSDPV